MHINIYTHVFINMHKYDTSTWVQLAFNVLACICFENSDIDPGILQRILVFYQKNTRNLSKISNYMLSINPVLIIKYLLVKILRRQEVDFVAENYENNSIDAL